ncbi:hypothetical protein GLOIN_2v1880570 [Rhizophagus irregularis DAOM 181602=DAOM 197198]|uniref:Uncharacterized protein n=1 Tax=Rhizophagus irregularis (strain DAOM 181602 / DAOM 197198 / MUCL 43194) TaxID=747089 RepID=A0A2P4PJA2_RHIID|nr:hypothetical protein GLOIN_2v1880570 [Rhizophagus irregularis DAOM 181602=DAOM 197198]POG65465.1 hypothetical protein GLOIN_2v1880570 [Rhizophagus irregularis DAOM 181602=DAOM 197198]|eukprot:XP_025172331.1 hypothetical protein GLOIN_2v1880570 [Rhizophagus irregularis DAOM 181602=DAOM 197198]
MTLKIKIERRGQGLKTYWEKLIREYSSVTENQQKNAQWITILHHLHTKKEFVQNEDDEAVARLENENISLNNRIPTLERIILGRRDEFSMNNKVEKTILGKSDEFSMNNKGVSHNWYGKDIGIRPCPNELLKLYNV